MTRKAYTKEKGRTYTYFTFEFHSIQFLKGVQGRRAYQPAHFLSHPANADKCCRQTLLYPIEYYYLLTENYSVSHFMMAGIIFYFPRKLRGHTLTASHSTPSTIQDQSLYVQPPFQVQSKTRSKINGNRYPKQKTTIQEKISREIRQDLKLSLLFSLILI